MNRSCERAAAVGAVASSWPGWLELVEEVGWRGKSLGRVLANNQIRAAFHPAGVTLDLGSGAASSYRLRYLDTSRVARYLRADLVPSYHPDVVLDLERQLPFRERAFDSILLVNVTHLIYDLRALMREICRVLAPGGAFYACTPFLAPLMPEPIDYGRQSAECLARMLSEAGFVDLAIEPVGGLFAAVFTMAQPLLRWPILTAPAAALATAGDRIIEKVRGDVLRHRYALGYVLSARRPQT
ncbi:MAG: class I SAM-dependent methyltransferase [Candidatus Riflebacteria bacterium]|nr:class I SAM-dependent methyltransferase [Candidatus Riflebacteria bacterium]